MSRLRIRSAESLHEALASPDLGIRLAVLRAIAADPARALAFGKFDGGDMVDWLISRAGQTAGVWRQAVVSTLAAFRQARVGAFFLQEYERQGEPEMVFLAAARLRQEPREVWETALRRGLIQSDCAVRARAAARVLGDIPLPSERERLRLGLLRGAAPTFEPEARQAWLDELDGPFAIEAQRALEKQGCGAFDALLMSWTSLSVANQAWLLRWAWRCWPGRVEPCLALALASAHEEILSAALRCAALLSSPGRAMLTPLLTSLMAHPKESIRAAAIRAAPPGVDLRRRIDEERSAAVRAACVRRLGREAGRAALGTLVELIGAPEVAVRAAATEALIDLGEDAAVAVRPLLRDQRTAVRAAACQVLLAAGKAEWLQAPGSVSEVERCDGIVSAVVVPSLAAAHRPL